MGCARDVMRPEASARLHPKKVDVHGVLATLRQEFVPRRIRRCMGEVSPAIGVVDEFLLYWQPAFGIEAGKVNDAGGNEALAGLGSFKRLVAEVGFNLIFPKSTNLTFNASYAHRWLRDDHVERGFVTAGFQYNIAPNFALTLTYRNGRKPDTFEKTSELLLGIGLMKTK